MTGRAVKEVEYPFTMHRLRFMFSDGECLDVITPITDSRVNAWAFEQHFGFAAGGKGKGDPTCAIAGWTELEVE